MSYFNATGLFRTCIVIFEYNLIMNGSGSH